MGRIGFIDLNSKDSGDVYVFKGRPGKYELEKSFEFSGNGFAKSADINEAYLSLPLELLNFRILKLPFPDKDKLVKVIPFELESLTLESSDRVVFDAIVLGKSGESFDVLVAYVEKDALKNILDKLASLNIDTPVVTSLELYSAAEGSKADIASRLVNPIRPGRDKRIASAKNELSSHTINLRAGTLAYTKDVEKIGKSLRVTMVLLLLLALMIDSYLAFKIITSRNDISAVKKEMRNIYSSLFPDEKRITDELYQMKSHLKEMKEKGDALIGVYPLRFLLELSQRTMPGTAFNEIGVEKDIFTLKGEANSMAEIDETKRRLSEFLADISISDIKPSPNGKSFFTLVAKGYKAGNPR